jgi:hypothetical protein
VCTQIINRPANAKPGEAFFVNPTDEKVSGFERIKDKNKAIFTNIEDRDERFRAKSAEK